MKKIRPSELKGRVKLVIHAAEHYADLKFYGPITRKLLDQTFLELIQAKDFKANFNAIYDYCDAYSDLEMPEIQEHAQFVSHHLGARGKSYKLALVANDTLNMALLEVYKLLVSKTSVEVEVFSEHWRAVDWIISQE